MITELKDNVNSREKPPYDWHYVTIWGKEVLLGLEPMVHDEKKKKKTKQETQYFTQYCQW